MRPRCLLGNTVLTFLQHSIRPNGVTLHPRSVVSLATHPRQRHVKIQRVSLLQKEPTENRSSCERPKRPAWSFNEFSHFSIAVSRARTPLLRLFSVIKNLARGYGDGTIKQCTCNGCDKNSNAYRRWKRISFAI